MPSVKITTTVQGVVSVQTRALAEWRALTLGVNLSEYIRRLVEQDVAGLPQDEREFVLSKVGREQPPATLSLAPAAEAKPEPRPKKAKSKAGSGRGE